MKEEPKQINCKTMSKIISVKWDSGRSHTVSRRNTGISSYKVLEVAELNSLYNGHEVINITEKERVVIVETEKEYVEVFSPIEVRRRK